jgi:type II secretory pathway pseudopilin PulG
MAALLVGMSVMAIMLSAAYPVWRTAVQREREAELIFRGEQYAHAIELYSRRNGGYPASLDVLEKGRFIRKLYKDPVSDDANFQPLFLGQTVAGQPVTPRQPGGAAGQTGVATPVTAQQPARGTGGAAQTAQPPSQPVGQARGAFENAPGQGVTGGAVAGGPIIGVISRNNAESLRIYNGRGRYNEWAFVATAMTTQAGAPGTLPTPGNAPGAGRRGGPPGPRGAPPAGRSPFGPQGPRGGAGPARGGPPAR